MQGSEDAPNQADRPGVEDGATRGPNPANAIQPGADQRDAGRKVSKEASAGGGGNSGGAGGGSGGGKGDGNHDDDEWLRSLFNVAREQASGVASASDAALPQIAELHWLLRPLLRVPMAAALLVDRVSEDRYFLYKLAVQLATGILIRMGAEKGRRQDQFRNEWEAAFARIFVTGVITDFLLVWLLAPAVMSSMDVVPPATGGGQPRAPKPLASMPRPPSPRELASMIRRPASPGQATAAAAASAEQTWQQFQAYARTLPAHVFQRAVTVAGPSGVTRVPITESARVGCYLYRAMQLAVGGAAASLAGTAVTLALVSLTRFRRFAWRLLGARGAVRGGNRATMANWMRRALVQGWVLAGSCHLRQQLLAGAERLIVDERLPWPWVERVRGWGLQRWGPSWGGEGVLLALMAVRVVNCVFDENRWFDYMRGTGVEEAKRTGGSVISQVIEEYGDVPGPFAQVLLPLARLPGAHDDDEEGDASYDAREIQVLPQPQTPAPLPTPGGPVPIPQPIAPGVFTYQVPSGARPGPALPNARAAAAAAGAHPKIETPPPPRPHPGLGRRQATAPPAAPPAPAPPPPRPAPPPAPLLPRPLPQPPPLPRGPLPRPLPPLPSQRRPRRGASSTPAAAAAPAPAAAQRPVSTPGKPPWEPPPACPGPGRPAKAARAAARRALGRCASPARRSTGTPRSSPRGTSARAPAAAAPRPPAPRPAAPAPAAPRPAAPPPRAPAPAPAPGPAAAPKPATPRPAAPASAPAAAGARRQ
eukprot:tig00001415_g8683.t1